jgi:hypothetical protein
LPKSPALDRSSLALPGSTLSSIHIMNDFFIPVDAAFLLAELVLQAGKWWQSLLSHPFG